MQRILLISPKSADVENALRKYAEIICFIVKLSGVVLYMQKDTNPEYWEDSAVMKDGTKIKVISMDDDSYKDFMKNLKK